MDEDELVDAGAELDWELEEEVLKGAAADHLLIVPRTNNRFADKEKFPHVTVFAGRYRRE